MTRMLKRQLNDEEKAEILRQFGRSCFATGHEIPESEEVQFDHIRAYALDGPTELGNIAPMCAQHNREKSTLSLGDFRVKLLLNSFFTLGDKLTLRHLLEYLQERGDIQRFAEPVATTMANDMITIESPSKRYHQNLYTCPTTDWKYFYATLDVDVLDSDDEQDHQIGLQPRYLIRDKVFDLFRHFQFHPVLQPSIGRIVNDRIRLFDGQHKIAALYFAGRRTFECKVYVTHDLRLLNQTNISAHDKFAQTRFFSSIMVLKLGNQFGADFQHYKDLEDGEAKSEAGFMEYIKTIDVGTQTRGQLRTRFRSYLYSSILEHDDNRLKRLVSASNRRTEERPLTMDMLERSLFTYLLYREPVVDNMATDSYRRQTEIDNVVSLMNMLYDEALVDWNPRVGASDPSQRRLSRIFGSKSMMAWAELLHGAICGKLELHDNADRTHPFYRILPERDIQGIRNIVGRLLGWNRWNAPPGDELDRVISGNKSTIKQWFTTHGLTTGCLMGAPE